MEGEKIAISTSICGLRVGCADIAGDEDAAEVCVEEVDYFVSVRVEDTVAVTKAFVRVSAFGCLCS